MFHKFSGPVFLVCLSSVLLLATSQQGLAQPVIPTRNEDLSRRLASVIDLVEIASDTRGVALSPGMVAEGPGIELDQPRQQREDQDSQQETVFLTHSFPDVRTPPSRVPWATLC